MRCRPSKYYNCKTDNKAYGAARPILLEKIKEQVEKCRRDGLDRADFEREKKCVYASYVSDFDSTEDIAFALTSYAYDGINVFDFPKIIDGVTFEYVTELLNNVFSDECYTLSAILPQNEE